MGMNGRDLRKDNADDSDKDRKVSGNAVLSFQNAFRSACLTGLPAVAVISCDSTDFDQAIIMTTAIYFHPICQLHEMGAHHPESPARMKTMMNAFRESGLDRILQYRLSPESTERDIRRVHTQDMINKAKDNIPEPGDYYPLDETPLNHYSWKAALRTTGAALAATDAVLSGEIRNAFCIERPIGHHSTIGEAMGFCVFNSLAIAAMHAVKVRKLERVAIVDIDVHHGNGTEDIFSYEPSVLMVSYYQQYLYPFCGNEKERANMVNVPVPPGTGGDVIRRVVTEKWLPALHRHKPEMIFISAGFDAHRDDQLGDMNLVEEDYAWITRQVMDVADQYCQGRIVSFSEGGYNLKALAGSVVAHVKTLAGQS